MLDIDPDDLALYEEYSDNLFGPYSPALQRLLIIMRANTVDNPHGIVDAQDGGFGLGTVSDIRGDPVQAYRDVQLHTYADASRSMFKLRCDQSPTASGMYKQLV